MYIDPSLGHIIENVVKDEKGNINAYVLENGEVIPKEQAVIMANQGAIRGVSKEISNEGEEFLNSLPTQERNGFLATLPEPDESVLD